MSVVTILTEEADYLYCILLAFQVECIYVELNYTGRTMPLLSERMNTMFLPIAVSVKEWQQEKFYESQKSRLSVEYYAGLDRNTEAERPVWILMFVLL